MAKLPVLFLMLGLWVVGCATAPPLDEYTLARTALEAAKEQDSARYAPSYFHQAEEQFREGEVKFKNHDFREAEENFIQARQFAEKAENASRAQKYKSGEVGP